MSSKRVTIFGGSGMLGQYVYRYLSDKDYQVLGLTRIDFDIVRDINSDLDLNADVVVNCAGIIKQRNPSMTEMITVNSVFPHRLAEVCESRQIPLIHITTDCVFDGLTGGYDELAKHDATDGYGKSKSLGEPESATVIRTSIIGEEPFGRKLSLLEWFKSCTGETYGFENHKWNGVTCLQLAKIIEEIIRDNLYWKGVAHIHSPVAVSKRELVETLKIVYDVPVDIMPHNTPVACDRTLATNLDHCSYFNIPDITQQIREQAEFELR